MRRELAAVYDELLRRHRDGEAFVSLSPESMAFLQEVAAKEFESSAHVPASAQADAMVAPAARLEPAASPEPEPEPVAVIPAAPEVSVTGADKVEQLAKLKSQVEADPWCRSQLKPNRRIVFGAGNPDAEIFFCGEAPGEEEERQGLPFVGPAGEVLSNMITAMRLSRDAVYIANIMNYRPPMPTPIGNRAPTAAEMTYCLPYLRAQIAIVRPMVIVALGKTAVDGLLGPDPKRRMLKIRGHWQEFEAIPLMPTLHPSYLLRDKRIETRRLVWEDMLAVMERVGLAISDRQRGFFLKG